MNISIGNGLLGSALLAGLAIAGFSAQASAAETKSYVVNWFYMDNYYGGDADCPDGLNLSSIEFYRRDMVRLGYTKEQIDKILDGYPGAGDGKGPWVPIVVHRGNGKDDIYENPTTEPDPGLKIVQGHFAHGFNLDGKGAASPNAFEEPDTHEKGINNQLYRLVGCIRSYRGGEGKATRPAYSDYIWDVLRDRMPAWLISVTSDGGKDGDATVALDRALETITRDASGANVRTNMTYRIDPDPRAHSVLHGKIKDGVLTTDAAEVNFVADAFGLTPDLHFRGAKLRLQLKPDGSLKGVIGGYQRWSQFYWGNGGRAWALEYLHSQDAVAIYYALRRMADANPDPKTGENQDISSAYAIEALPAFAVPADGVQQSAQAGGPVRTSQLH